MKQNNHRQSNPQDEGSKDTLLPHFYIVATPIGNRDDMTTRAMQTLGDVDFIACEDTRHSGQLLAFYGIKKPLISYRDAPKQIMDRAVGQIISRIKKGESGAYITDAGTPGISDPGWRLIASLLPMAQISPIPGPSAVSTIVSLADVRLDEYRFLGFLPKKKGYQTKLDDIAHYLNSSEARGVVFYESPNRIRRVLIELAAKVKGIGVVTGRELTKKFESIDRGELNEDFINNLPERGEYSVLIYTKPSKGLTN